MKADRIYELAEYIPDNSSYFPEPMYAQDVQSQTAAHRQRDINKFVRFYTSLDFGWGFVQSLIEAGRTLPDILGPEEEPLDRLYYYEMGYRESDPALEHAIALGQSYSYYEASVIKALLMVRGATCASVAKRTGLPIDVIECYEMLFFNILDRKHESLFISTYLYPQGRVGEAFEEHLDRQHVDKVLQRSGYNNGAEDVAWAAGLPTALYGDVDGNKAARELEALIMANGLYLARNGFLYDREKLADARGLLAAAKQGGTTEGHIPDEDLSNMADSMSDHLLEFSDEQFREFSNARRGIPMKDSVFVAPQTQLDKSLPEKKQEEKKKD